MPDLVVHFLKPSDWAETVRIHYWNAHPGGGQTQWPGTPMTVGEGGGFVYRFSGIDAANFLFTDGGGRQSSDLWREASSSCWDEPRGDGRPVGGWITLPAPAR